MTKPDCKLDFVFHGSYITVRRADCRSERTYHKVDLEGACSNREKLAPPPCLCVTMVEPWEMI